MSPKVATSTDILFLNSLVNTNTEGSQKVRFNIIFVIVNFVIIPIIIIIIITVLVNTPTDVSVNMGQFLQDVKIPLFMSFLFNLENLFGLFSSFFVSSVAHLEPGFFMFITMMMNFKQF